MSDLVSVLFVEQEEGSLREVALLGIVSGENEVRIMLGSEGGQKEAVVISMSWPLAALLIDGVLQAYVQASLTLRA